MFNLSITFQQNHKMQERLLQNIFSTLLLTWIYVEQLCYLLWKGLYQGWPTFLASGPNFRNISVGGPKISSKKIWRAKKKNIFYHLYLQKSMIYSENFEKIFAGPFKMSRRAKNGPRAPGWPPLVYTYEQKHFILNFTIYSLEWILLSGNVDESFEWKAKS